MMEDTLYRVRRIELETRRPPDDSDAT
jgi:hypothetical protein